MTVPVQVLASPAAVASAAADAVIALAKARIEVSGRFTVALAGGSTPKALYEVLASRSGELDWSKVVVLFGDDRCVPPDHEMSNFAMASAALLSKVSVSQDNLHRIRGDDGDRLAAAQAYEATLGEVLGDDAIDLVLLGMGPDGHTASLFPGDDAPADRRVFAVVAPPSSPIEDRVSLTYAAIAAAGAVIALVTGAGKRDRLREVLTEDPDLPMARVIRARGGDVTFMIDQAAHTADDKEQR